MQRRYAQYQGRGCASAQAMREKFAEYVALMKRALRQAAEAAAAATAGIRLLPPPEPNLAASASAPGTCHLLVLACMLSGRVNCIQSSLHACTLEAFLHGIACMLSERIYCMTCMSPLEH
jgi:hypothetical protein